MKVMSQSSRTNADIAGLSDMASGVSDDRTNSENAGRNGSLVEISELVKSFRDDAPPALDHLDTRVPAGAITGLAGPDGAGKTTLMRLLAGLLLPTAGTIRGFGFDPT